MNSTPRTHTPLPRLAARALRTATIGSVALSLALSSTALADSPPPMDGPPDAPPITDVLPPVDAQAPQPAATPAAEPAPEPAADPAPEHPGETPAEQPAAPPAPTGSIADAAPPVKTARPSASRSPKCAKKKTRKARRRCRAAAKRHAVRKAGVFARSAMQGVTLGSATCTGQQGAKTMHVTGPTLAAGQPFQWLVSYNGLARWTGQWLVDTQAWVGPFFMRTDYPGWFYYNGAWTHASNGGGASNHYVGGGYAVGVQYVYAYSSKQTEYRYIATTDNMSPTGAPVTYCGG